VSSIKRSQSVNHQAGQHIRLPFELLQLSLRLQGRTFGAPGLAARRPASPAGLTARARPKASPTSARRTAVESQALDQGERASSGVRLRTVDAARAGNPRTGRTYLLLPGWSLVSRCSKRRTIETKPTMPKARRATTMMVVHHMLTISISRYILLSPSRRPHTVLWITRGPTRSLVGH
jgi:hypothetical protein